MAAYASGSAVRRSIQSLEIAMSLDVATFFHDAFFSGFGWRYVLSPAFRRKMHAAWKAMPRRDVIDEATTLVVSFVFANAVLISVVVAWVHK